MYSCDSKRSMAVGHTEHTLWPSYMFYGNLHGCTALLRYLFCVAARPARTESCVLYLRVKGSRTYLNGMYEDLAFWGVFLGSCLKPAQRYWFHLYVFRALRLVLVSFTRDLCTRVHVYRINLIPNRSNAQHSQSHLWSTLKTSVWYLVLAVA